jgi:outer membrane protein assembly factor BamB
MNESINRLHSKSFYFKGSKEDSIRLAINTAIIAGIFSAIISILILLNYVQLATNNPVDSQTMKALVQQLNSDPNNEQLLTEIRSFDLMARKAYFTSKWQIETGGILLLLGVIVMVISLRYYFSTTAKIEEPAEVKIPQNLVRLLSSRWILGLGLVVFVLAMASSFFSVNQLDQYKPGLATVADSSASTKESIEVVDLSSQANQKVPAADTAKVTDKTTTSVKAPASDSIKVSAIQGIAKAPSLATIKKQSNSFRGPLGQGVSFCKNIPTTWDVAAGNNIKWKVKVPKRGYNSPVIWANNLFITGADATERWLYCYDRNDGKLLWQYHVQNIPGSPATPPKTTDDTGLAAPTVTTDGNFVAAIFATGDLVVCDFSGKLVWAKNLGVPANHYGHASSLIYWKGSIIVQYDTNKDRKLIALDLATGNPVWETPRTSHISWASPILAEIGGKMQVVTSSEPTVAGYDAMTGKELWKNDCMMGEVGPSPAFGSGLVFAGNEYATVAAIDPSNGTVVWQENDYMPEVASPLVADGMLILATSYGMLVNYDAKTGTKNWEHDFGEGFYSSPVAVDGKLFAADTKGVVHIMKLSAQFEKISDNPTGEKIMATPTFSDGCIYLRGVDNLYCIGK